MSVTTASPMKKVINDVDHVVPEMLEGMVLAHPNELALNAHYKIIHRKQLNPKKVTLISGGGSGHEPAHAGFVGQGMLDAAVCGDVFASPSTIQVYQAIAKTESEAGTLLIIKNYSGDCMNFDAAAEMAEEDDEIEVAKVYVNDDVAIAADAEGPGRRGVAGTLYVHKIAGAAAEAGWSLAEVTRVAQKTIDNVRSLGFALNSCTVPAKGSPTFSLGEGELEFGVGIHGEPGIQREPLRSADELAAELLERIVHDLPFTAGDEVAVLVNGLGATPLQELYLLNRAVAQGLSERSITVNHTLVGTYMSAIDMIGASLTLLRLDDELKSLLNAPVNTPSWKQ